MDTASPDSGSVVGSGRPEGSAPKAGTPDDGKPAGKVARNFWLNGDVLACACPDCGAPMSVRVWLMVADCLHCEASIELTPEQQREAEKLLARRGEPAAPVIARSAFPPVLPPAPKPQPEAALPPTVSQKKPNIPVAKLVKTGPMIPPPPQPLPLPAPVSTMKISTLAKPPPARRPRRPLWPILLMLVWVALAAYALWSYLHGDQSSTTVAKTGASSPIQKKPELPTTWQAKRETRPASAPPKPIDLKAERAADELTLPHDASAGLSDLSKVIDTVKTPSPDRMFEGRDPRIRSNLVEEEGGSIYTEAAVAAGLHWLSGHQAGDGSWSLARFPQAGDCNGRCDGEGDESDTAATALALLPFLGAGQTPKQGIHRDAVDRGLKWLVGHEKPDGDLQGTGTGRMYAHGLATIVLCEAVAMSGDDSLRPAAQRAIDFIVESQHEGGGWRYRPGEEGDMSVVGWQLMALQSGKGAYLNVPQSTLDRAGEFLDTVETGRRGGLFVYQPGRGPTPAMTAEGLLSRQYLGWPQVHPGLREGINRLLRDDLPNKRRPNIYYWYYATQVMHHVGGEPWKKWNSAVRDALLAMQEKEGHPAGSWAPRGGAIGEVDSRAGGRIYMTSLALCTLEVYYRYLPLYRGIEIRQ